MIQDASGTKSFRVREKQLKELTYFILTKTIEDEYPIVLVGDFNVDARSEMPEKKNSEEYETMMKLLTTEYFQPIDLLLEEGKIFESIIYLHILISFQHLRMENILLLLVILQLTNKLGD